MNKKETTQIITFLAGNYSSISEKTIEQKQIMLNTWQECLGDLNYNIVLQAVKKTILSSKYLPTISEIRKNAIELMNPNKNKTGIEAWEEAYKMICNGTYMTQEEFDTHSDEVKKFFGSTTQLKAYSTNTDFNMDVVRSNFLKQYDILIKRKEEMQILPQNMQNMIQNVSNKISLGERKMKKCINCSYFLSCKEAEENKVECDKFIKRKLGKNYVEKNNNGYYINNSISCS
jgi:hypothetical protein